MKGINPLPPRTKGQRNSFPLLTEGKKCILSR